MKPGVHGWHGQHIKTLSKKKNKIKYKTKTKYDVLIALTRSVTRATEGRKGLLWLTVQGCSPLQQGRHGGGSMRRLLHGIHSQEAESHGSGAQLAVSF